MVQYQYGDSNQWNTVSFARTFEYLVQQHTERCNDWIAIQTK